MPYYCTVPNCTSMAGKDKGISFHQFPRDETMAHLWNKVLKRGKPYTKFSKVCSLHFTPKDYMISNPDKGTWRTLRKDAVPTQNLPNKSPSRVRRNSSPAQNQSKPLYFPQYQYQNQLAHMMYIHNMVLQAAGVINAGNAVQQPPSLVDYQHTSTDDESTSNASSTSNYVKNILTEAELTQRLATPSAPPSFSSNSDTDQNSYQCNDCMKVFKDRDVYTLHKRNHRKELRSETTGGKENCISVSNTQRTRQDTLQANPILANLLTTNSNFEHHVMPAYIPVKTLNDDS